MVAQKKLSIRKFKEVKNVNTGDYKPFWNPNPKDFIEGDVGNLRSMNGNFGPQDIIDVGEFSVNLSAGLAPMYKLLGKFVRLTYIGMENNPNTGRDFKKFKIEVSED